MKTYFLHARACWYAMIFTYAHSFQMLLIFHLSFMVFDTYFSLFCLLPKWFAIYFHATTTTTTKVCVAQNMNIVCNLQQAFHASCRHLSRHPPDMLAASISSSLRLFNARFGCVATTTQCLQHATRCRRQHTLCECMRTHTCGALHICIGAREFLIIIIFFFLCRHFFLILSIRWLRILFDQRKGFDLSSQRGLAWLSIFFDISFFYYPHFLLPPFFQTAHHLFNIFHFAALAIHILIWPAIQYFNAQSHRQCGEVF